MSDADHEHEESTAEELNPYRIAITQFERAVRYLPRHP